MSANAPPGGGPNAVVVASTQPAAPAVTDDQNPLPQNPAPATQPAADALSLAPAPAPAPEPTPTPTHTEVPDYGDNGLNIAADYFVNTLGLDINGRELSEAAKGNFHLLEAKLEVLGEKAKGSGPMLRLAQEAVSRVQNATKAQHAETVTKVHEAVGGEANWKAVQQYARTSLPADQLKQAQDTLSQGGLAAVAMARHLLSLASSHPQVTVQGQPTSSSDGVSQSLQGVAPLTREQYRSEYKKLIASMGIKGASNSPELRALNARVIN
jgi:hypothetical protein